jgi:hypothetical protein
MRAFRLPYIFLIFCLTFVLTLFCIRTPLTFAAPSHSQRSLPTDFLLGGIQIREPDQELWTSALKNQGMNSVSVTTYADQGAWDSDSIFFESEDRQALLQIQSAKRAGMNVVFIPRVRLVVNEAHNRFTWHGMIMPADERQLESWFRKYSKFILSWAKECEKQGVEVFAIGSELTELTSTTPILEFSPLHSFYLQAPRIENATPDDSQSKHRAWAAALTFEGVGDTTTRVQLINQRNQKLLSLWKGLIKDVRAVFKGHITYAANFDAFTTVSFWNDLDLVGINAYFELRNAATLTTERDALAVVLVDGWTAALKAIEGFLKAADIKQQVLFTEIGYTRRVGSTVYPWDHEGIRLPQSPLLDSNERVLAVRALSEALKANKIQFLRGLLYWRLSTMEREREYEPYLAVLGSKEDRDLFKGLREVAKRRLPSD